MPCIGIKTAVKAAFKSNHKSARLGACIVKGGRILSIGWNTDKKYNKLSWYWDFHAEVHAILSIGIKNIPNNSKLYVCRIQKNNNLSMAKPCDKCMALAKKAGITQIYYTDWNGEVTKLKIYDITSNINIPRYERYGKQ